MLAAALVLTTPGIVRGGPRVILVAGDIAKGTPTSQEHATADLVAARSGLVMTAGDNAYESGTLEEFRTFYHPSWGRFLDRTRATLGNHEYRTPGAAGYFAYFGWRAGPRRADGSGVGYYAFKHGPWLVLALDSETCRRKPGCGPRSAQHRWLRRKLAEVPARCSLAVWHRPPYSSGVQSNDRHVLPLLRVLYENGVDILVNGHDHHYERFAPARPDGTRDRRFGVRQFIVGTGGAPLRPRGSDVPAHSEVFGSDVHGVLKLTLRHGRYDWQFLPVTEGAFSDSGSGRCHGEPR
jgi:alkaline phosphatase